MEPDAPRSEVDLEQTTEQQAEAAASDPVLAEPVELGVASSAPADRTAESHPEFLVEPAAVTAAASRPPTSPGGPLRLLGYLLAGTSASY